jgi:hypothetical protein
MKALTHSVALAMLVSGSLAQAAGPFFHPATGGTAQSGAEQSTAACPVLIGHPASPRWKQVHANGEHPAVIVAARPVTIDPNLFIVQPPASVQWTVAPASETQVAATAR